MCETREERERWEGEIGDGRYVAGAVKTLPYFDVICSGASLLFNAIPTFVLPANFSDARDAMWIT